MIVNHWKPTFTKLYGHAWPSNYLALDTEHSIDPAEKGILLSVGHVLVENGRVVDKLNLIFDWTDHPIVPLSWVRTALARLDLHMKGGNKITVERMQREGIKPEKALNFYYDLFQTVRKRGFFFAAHHGYRADEPFIVSNLEGFAGKRFRFGANELFDTGAIAKASLCLDSSDPKLSKRSDVWLPRVDDTLRDYFIRVVNYPAKGVLWNLAECIRRYGIAEKQHIRPEDLHEAVLDALCVHHLMEFYRSEVRPTSSTFPLGPQGLENIFSEKMSAVYTEKDAEAQAKAAAEDEFEARQAERPRSSAGRRARALSRRRGQRSV